MRRPVSLVALLMLLVGCTSLPPVNAPAPAAGPVSTPRGAPVVRDAAGSPLTGEVRSTLVPGRPAMASVPNPRPSRRSRGGAPVVLNFPGVDVQAVAQAVVGGILGLPVTVAPDLHQPITLAPGRPVPRGEVLPLLEQALRQANLALVAQPAGGYAVLTVDQAKSAAPVSAAADDAAVGFASEAIHLRFVNAEELRRLIDPVLPGVVTGADAQAQVLTVAGTPGQRASARDLVRQFDVDWLRGTSFGLFVPRRTDARLIAPELDKLLNADGSPTKNLVRLIAMERLNGILAVTTQPQYLDDVRRWIEILDREGESAQRRLWVYHVQNGRAGDLAKVLASAFGQAGAQSLGSGSRAPALGFSDSTTPPSGVVGPDVGAAQAQGSGIAPGGLGGGGFGGSAAGATGQVGASGMAGGGGGLGGASLAAAAGGAGAGAGSGAPVSVEVNAPDFHARITSDEFNNAIVVYATPRDYAVVEDALRKLDVAPTQVMIQAAIVEVTLSDQLRFGVQGLYSNRGLTAGLSDSLTSQTPVAELPGFSALYAAKSVTAALNALENLTSIRVVSAPKLMVLNNQTASIEVGNQVPILTGSATSVIGSNAPIVNSVEYRDTGIILKVTPRVNSSGAVLLDLAQEVSDVVPAASTSSIDSPTFSTRRVATSVAVHDGELVALGGLIRDSRERAKGGLPFLSRIPVLGPALFGNIENTDARTELIVLMQPTVVRNTADARAVTDELRDKLQSLRGLLPEGRSP